MDLEDLQKKIYSPDKEVEGRPEPSTTFSPGEKHFEEEKKEWSGQQPAKKLKLSEKIFNFFTSLFSFSPAQKKYFFIITAILLILILGLIGIVYWYGRTTFDRAWVTLNIEGPEKVVSGEEIIYIVKYQNNTKVPLNDAQITFYWPENSVVENNELIKKISLNNIAPGESKEIQFKGKLIGLKGTEKELKTTLSYQPAKTKARFENVAVFRTSIISVPLVLNFDMPEKTSDKQQITIALRYLNDSDAAFEGLVIKVEYPEGFKISSTYPQPKENLWQIGTLDSEQEGKILITGIIEGERGETKTFRAYIGVLKNGDLIPYSETVKSTQIGLPVLVLDQIINNSHDYVANPGEVLNYRIKYQNTSHLGVPSVKIVLKFNTQALDFTSLDLQNKGFFDSTTNSIVWDQSNTPDLGFLDPGKEGEINFAVKVKENLPIKTFNDKNFTIQHVLTSESSNVPLALINQQISDTLKVETKINSRLTIEAKGFYEDTLLPNTGPIPPKVGQITTYTLYWQITNTSNDIENAQVETILPFNVLWLNKFNPSSSIFEYDPLNRKLVWKIGKLSAGTGIITPAKFVAFQVALTPSATQVNQLAEIIKGSVLTGKDSFTGTNLESRDAPILTDLPDDSTIGWTKGTVSQ